MGKRKKMTSDEPTLTPEEAAEILGGEKKKKEKTWNVPATQIDERDPYGKIRSRMLDERTRVYELHGKEPGLWAHELARKYEQEHPEFEAEYQAELKRRA